MTKYKKITIMVMGLILMLVGGFLFFLKADKKVMPAAACSNGDEIFIIGNIYDDKSGDLLASDIYVLDKDSDKMSLYQNTTLGDSASFEKITLDDNDNLYAIVRKQDEIGKYEIWEIGNGTVLNKYDITNSIDEENRGGIRAFTIDGDGNFFIRERFSDEVIVINKMSLEVSRLKDVANDISFESMATGKDGEVYALFCRNIDAGGGYKIISFANGIINEICEGELLPYDEIYSVMGTSTKYDLVMKGMFGVYGYNFNLETAENIMYLPSPETEYTKSFISEDKLYIFFIDVDDVKRHKVKSIELKTVDLATGVLACI